MSSDSSNPTTKGYVVAALIALILLVGGGTAILFFFGFGQPVFPVWAMITGGGLILLGVSLVVVFLRNGLQKPKDDEPVIFPENRPFGPGDF